MTVNFDNRDDARRLLLIPRNKAFAMVGCGPTKGHELINAGLLDARKLGVRTLITMESIKALVDGLPRAGKRLELSGHAGWNQNETIERITKTSGLAAMGVMV